MSNMTRRDFLKNAAVGAASLAAVSAMGIPAVAAEESAESSYAALVDETVDVDVVIMGAGSSGLCATVQAAQLGMKTLCLEVNAMIGGNGRGTEGVFALGSFMQKEQGIEVTFKEIISKELDIFNYRINALLWKDMVENSGDNLQWLVDNGVKFSGVVDYYYDAGKVPCFHWFVDADGSNYVDPMAAKAVELGAEIRTETRGRELIMKDGKVAGMYAEKADGKVLQINAPAVILAGGGYANNVEMMAERGYDLTYSIDHGIAGHQGDGLAMAIKVGAEDVSRERCFLREPYTCGINFFGSMYMKIGAGGPVLYVNQDAERYTNENAGAFTKGCNSNAVHTQEKSFFIFDSALLNEWAKTTENLVEDVEAAVEACPANNIYKADTIEELAEKVHLDPAALAATLERYNSLCELGDDQDFGKPAEKMVALKTAPYYIFQQHIAFWTSIGGIKTNRKFEVVDPKGVKIPGLYAVGTEGCELYRDTYTMNVPASCQGNNVNSGRMAAKNAKAYIEG